MTGAIRSASVRGRGRRSCPPSRAARGRCVRTMSSNGRPSRRSSGLGEEVERRRGVAERRARAPSPGARPARGAAAPRGRRRAGAGPRRRRRRTRSCGSGRATRRTARRSAPASAGEPRFEGLGEVQPAGLDLAQDRRRDDGLRDRGQQAHGVDRRSAGRRVGRTPRAGRRRPQSAIPTITNGTVPVGDLRRRQLERWTKRSARQTARSLLGHPGQRYRSPGHGRPWRNLPRPG